MEKVRCYKCGTLMRWIPRLKQYFCDVDGYMIGAEDAILNHLLVEEPAEKRVQAH